MNWETWGQYTHLAWTFEHEIKSVADPDRLFEFEMIGLSQDFACSITSARSRGFPAVELAGISRFHMNRRHNSLPALV